MTADDVIEGNADGTASDIVTIGMLLYAARVRPPNLPCAQFLIAFATLQILDQVDAPCRRVDFLKGSMDPSYIDGFGYPCYEVSGQEVSNISKRDLGLTLNIIITYKNTLVQLHATTVPVEIQRFLNLARAGMEKMNGVSFPANL
jgi:hypothetical protein